MSTPSEQQTQPSDSLPTEQTLVVTITENTTEVTQPEASALPVFTHAQLEASVKAAQELLAKGNYEECCSIIEEAMKQAEKVYGEASFESARLHFELGSTLLQKVESSRDVFGDGIKTGEKPAEGNNEEEQGEDQKDTTTGEEQQLSTIVESKEEAEENDKRDRVDIEEEAPENKETITPAAVEQGEIEERPDEDVDDLQVAWEQMEVARVYLEKLVQVHDMSDPNIDQAEVEKDTKISRLLAQVMLRLGDANCYRENFDAAIQDYEKCLQLRKVTEDTFFSRDLAEIYYLLGNAHLYKNYETCDEVALGQFNRARVILENLLYKIMGSSAVKDPEDLQTHTTFMSREYLKPSIFETEKGKELKEILSELYNKIDDTTEQKKERARVAEELKKAKLQAEASQMLESTFSKPVLGAQSDDPNATNKPAPKVIHLGTLGSAALRKRNRDEMEKTTANVTFNEMKSHTGSQGAGLQQRNPNVTQEPKSPIASEKLTVESEGQLDSLSGKATKVDEQGHVEKMSKI